MTRKSLWLAAFVVLISNAAALGYAWMNRQGEPTAELVLTEREVRLLPREAENTAIALRLTWFDPTRSPGAASWFDASRLTALGFDCTAPVTSENAMFYRGQAPRAAYAALEYEGERWRQYVASVPEGPERQAVEAGSHLVLADVGLDPRALRRAHPDRRRVVIVPATVGIEFRQRTNAPPMLVGRVNTAYPLEMSVPKHLRAAFEGLQDPPREPYEPEHAWRGTPLPVAPRFTVTLKWGRWLEPWLVAARRLDRPNS